MIRKITISLLTIGFIGILQGLAQDIHFSQFYQAPGILNPALTGHFEGSVSGILNYKERWGQVTTPYQTFAADVQANFLKDSWPSGYVGTGLSFYSDQAGTGEMGTNQGNLSISTQINLMRHHQLGAGLQASWTQRTIDVDELTWSSQYTGQQYAPSRPSREIDKMNQPSYGDLAGGLLWSYHQKSRSYVDVSLQQWEVGIAGFHFNQPNQTLIQYQDRLNLRWVLHGTGTVLLPDYHLTLVPAVMYTRQGPLQEMIAGVRGWYGLEEVLQRQRYLRQPAVSLGAHYRMGDAIIVSTFFKVQPFQLGFSYDIDISGLTVLTGGRQGFELSLRYSPSSALW